MNSKTQSPKDIVKAYLDSRAKEDPLFAEVYSKPNKNIDQCWTYIMGEARKRGNSVCMTDDEVFGLAVHYYDEDDIKVGKVNTGSCHATTSGKVELTEEEKKEAREVAKRKYEEQMLEEITTLNVKETQTPRDEKEVRFRVVSPRIECGLEFKYDKTSQLSIEIIGDKHKCPYCGALLDIKNSRKNIVREKAYFTIISTVGKYQLCRHFLASKAVKKGNHPGFDIRECVQNWISPDGKETIRARRRNAFTYYADSWSFSQPMEIRPDNANDSAYQIYAEAIYPYQGVTRLLRRNGYTAKCDGMPPSGLFKMLLKDNLSEMLIKTRQYSLLRLKYVRGHLNSKYLHSIRIANRNGYIVKDASMWIDYLELLEYFHLDTHNAHYVCPKDLKAEHDRLSARKRRVELHKETERKLKEAAKWETLYRENMGKFFGICFGNQEITISVITSVSDMATEGEAMHHCVFTAGYYKRPDSLILSARSLTGERLETIEVSLKTLKIVQSRAHCNQSGPKHAEIMDLVNKNMNLIKQAI